jgi:hypothetical protein
MHWKTDTCHLKEEFKELKLLRKEIGESYLDSILQLLYSVVVLIVPLLILNAITTSYIVWRIFAFQLGTYHKIPSKY